MASSETEFSGPDGITTLVGFHSEVRDAFLAFEQDFASNELARRLAAARELLHFLRGPLFDHEEAEDSLLRPTLERCGGAEHARTVKSQGTAHERLSELRSKAETNIEAYVESKGRADIDGALAAFIDAMRKHLTTEEQVIYPLATSILTPLDRRDLHWQLEQLYRLQELAPAVAPRNAKAPKAAKRAGPRASAKRAVKPVARKKASRAAPRKKKAAPSRRRA